MRRRPMPRPGVTTAATTAAFAMGDGPGDAIAAPTTAAFATGAPMTPTLPTLPTRMSGSFFFEYFFDLFEQFFVGFD